MNAAVRIFERLAPAGSFVRNVFVMLSGSAFSPVLMVLVMPVLSRLYTPEDFGVLAVFNAFLTVLVAAAALRYEGAVPLPADEEEGANLLMLGLGLSALGSVLTALVLWVAGGPLLRLTNAQALAPYLWLLPLALLAFSVFKVVNHWATRRKHFGDIARAMISQPLGNVVTAVSAGLAKLGPVGLLLGVTLGRSLEAALLLVLAVRRDGAALTAGVSWPRMLELAVRYRKFPLFQLPSSVLNALSMQISLIVMAMLYDLTVVGHYGVARRLFSTPMFIIVAAVAQVFLQKAAEEHNRGGDLKALVLRLYGKLFLIGIGPAVLVVLLAPWACRVALGAEWVTAGEYSRLLIPWLLLVFVSSPTTCVFAVLNRQDITLVYGIAMVVARVAAIAAGWYYFESAYWSLALYALVGALGTTWIMLKLLELAGRQRGGGAAGEPQLPAEPPVVD